MIKLYEGEVICSRCEGTGMHDEDKYVCDKCLGEGKLDWVTDIMGRPRTESVLDSVNVRQIMGYIRKVLNDEVSKDQPVTPIFIDHVSKIMETNLDFLESQRAIYNYDVTTCQKNQSIGITIQPYRAAEFINMDVKIT